MKKKRLNILPHPEKVLIKITKHEWSNLFSVWITRHDGTRMQLFKDAEEDEGFERRVKQNVSVGNIIAVGNKVGGILKGDIAILDYLVTGNDDAFIGCIYADRMVCIKAFTEYYKENSTPMIDGRLTWKEGDFKFLSSLIGVVRMGKIKAFSPYIVLKHEERTKMHVSESGLKVEKEDNICTREIIAASPESGYKDGDKILLKESDLFFRVIDGKEISVIFEQDVIAKVG